MAGALLITGNLWLVVAGTIIYIAYAATRVEREEKHLRKAFGAPYADYCREVPRFLPRPWPLAESRLVYVNHVWFRGNHGTVNALCLAGAYALILLLAP
jgi:hypothetical protein